jgi:ABC-2 type transport system ATP-binding protein
MESVQLIKVIIRKLRETGHTIIITSHILESLLNLCDTISYLKGKKIEATFLPPDFPSIESRLFDMANVRAQDHVNNLIN